MRHFIICLVKHQLHYMILSVVLSVVGMCLEISMAPFQKFLSLQLCATEIKENRERIIHPEMDALMEKRVQGSKKN